MNRSEDLHAKLLIGEVLQRHGNKEQEKVGGYFGVGDEFEHGGYGSVYDTTS